MPTFNGKGVKMYGKVTLVSFSLIIYVFVVLKSTSYRISIYSVWLKGKKRTVMKRKRYCFVCLVEGKVQTKKRERERGNTFLPDVSTPFVWKEKGLFNFIYLNF